MKNDDVTLSLLDNSELLLIYYKLLQQKEQLDEGFKHNRVPKVIFNSKGLKERIIYNEVSSDTIDKIKSDFFYTTLKSTLEKLKPIISLIEDCGDEYKEQANKLK